MEVNEGKIEGLLNNIGNNRLYLVVALIIMLVGIGILVGMSDCMEDYHERQCWKQENGKSKECLLLSNCIKLEEEETWWKEYLITLTATVVILAKKYWREVIKLICHFKETGNI